MLHLFVYSLEKILRRKNRKKRLSDVKWLLKLLLKQLKEIEISVDNLIRAAESEAFEKNKHVVDCQKKQ